MARRGKRSKGDPPSTVDELNIAPAVDKGIVVPTAPYPPMMTVPPITINPRTTILLQDSPASKEDDPNSKRNRPNGSTPQKNPNSSEGLLSDEDMNDGTIVCHLDAVLAAADVPIPQPNSNKMKVTAHQINPLGSALRKMGPQGTCSWMLGQSCCAHPSILLDSCGEQNCKNKVHLMCQTKWESTPVGTELGAGILQCPEHHEYYNSKLPAVPLTKQSSLTSALSNSSQSTVKPRNLTNTPNGKDSTWTPNASSQKKLSFAMEINVMEDKTLPAKLASKQGKQGTPANPYKNTKITSSAPSTPATTTGKVPYNHKHKFAVKVKLQAPAFPTSPQKCLTYWLTDSTSYRKLTPQ